MPNKRNEESDNEQIYTEYAYNISDGHMLFCFANATFGSGILKLGSSYRAGIIPSLIMTVGLGVISHFSIWYFLRAAVRTKSGSFDEIWKSLWGKKYQWICSAICIISKIWTIVSYFSLITDSIISLIYTWVLNPPRWLTQKIFIITIECAVFVIPISFARTLTFVVITSQIACLAVLVLFAIIVYFFITTVMDEGFNPNHELIYFGSFKNILSHLSSLMTAYSIFPLAYPSFNHLKVGTYKRLNRIILINSIACITVYCAFGLLCYFTLFEKNIGGIVFQYFPSSPARLVGEIALAILIVLSIPVVLSPLKYIILNTVSTVRTIQSLVWIQMGISIGLFCAYMSIENETIILYVSSINDSFQPIILFIAPAIFYLKTAKTDSGIIKICAYLLGIFGVGCTVLII